MSKKVLSLVMAAIVLFSTLSFSTNNARAAGTITYQGGLYIVGKGTTFVFKGSDLKNGDIKGAKIFAGSSLYNLSCNVNKSAGKIVCVGGGRLTEFGGEAGIIYLGGQMFYITIPGTSLLAGGCDEDEVLGANVQFEDPDGTTFTVFVPGEGMQEVSITAANQAASSELAGYHVVGADVYCDSVEVEEESPEPEVPEPEEEV